MDQITKVANNYFIFKQFTIYQDRSAFKVGTDGVLLGASAALDGVKRILDIGSGTGLITLMVAQRSGAEIVAIEPDAGSYMQCCENVERSGWKARIKVENLTLQDFRSVELFDLVITNPPFFSDSLRNTDPRKSASRHNDLLTGAELLAGVSRLLSEDGKLQLILPYVEGTVMIAEAHKYNFFCNNILKIRPLPGSPVRRIILTFSRKQLRVTERFLTIEHGKRHNFTEEFMDLTKDYYLKF
jgi:tRNA1Val (adenine37-N6)-methyltransferase